VSFLTFVYNFNFSSWSLRYLLAQLAINPFKLLPHTANYSMSCYDELGAQNYATNFESFACTFLFLMSMHRLYFFKLKLDHGQPILQVVSISSKQLCL